MSIQVFWLVFSLFEKSLGINFYHDFVKLLVSDKWLLYYITNCLGRNPTSGHGADLVLPWNLRAGAMGGPNSSSLRNLQLADYDLWRKNDGFIPELSTTHNW